MNKLTTTTASTGGIAYCPANPDVMVRLSEGSAMGYYTTDGTTWQELPNVPLSGAKAAINQLEDGTYRILVSSSGKISYTDDFGKTWSTASTSDSLSSTIWMCVDEKESTSMSMHTATTTTSTISTASPRLTSLMPAIF